MLCAAAELALIRGESSNQLQRWNRRGRNAGGARNVTVERHALRVVPVGKDPVRELLGEVELRLHVVAVFMIPEHTVPRHLQRLGTVWPEKIGLAAKGGLDWE